MAGPDSAWRNRAPGPHRNTARQAMYGLWTAKTVKRPRQQPAHPQYANYWAPLTRKQHIPPHPAQPRHTDYWAPRTRKRHQQEHRPQRPTERSDPTQHAKGRTGDCPGPRKGATTRRNVTQGGGLLSGRTGALGGGESGAVSMRAAGARPWAEAPRPALMPHPCAHALCPGVCSDLVLLRVHAHHLLRRISDVGQRRVAVRVPVRQAHLRVVQV